MTTIKYNRLVQFLGRNGIFNQSGISVTASGLDPVPRTVTIEPITSKDVVGRSAIEIPQEQLGEVIKALFKELPDNVKTDVAIELLEVE